MSLVTSLAGGLARAQVAASEALRFPSIAFLRGAFLRSSAPTLAGVIADETPGRGTARPPQPGRAYAPDGTAGYVNGPTGIVTTQDFSVSMWLYCDLAAARYPFGQGSGFGANAKGVNVVISTSGQISINVNDGNASPISLVVANAGSFIANAWQLLTITFDRDGSATAYINSTQQLSSPISTRPGDLSGGPWTLGRYGAAALYFAGKISDFRIYGSVLTSAEVLELFELGAGALPSKATLVHYKGDDQHPTVAYDSSGNNRHGTKTSINAAVGQFHYEGADVPVSWQNEKGWSSVVLPTAVSWGNVGFASKELLTGDGSIQCRLPSTLSRWMIGFSSNNTNANFTTIQYALFAQSSGTYAIYESGTLKLVVVSPVQAAGDVLKVERVGTAVRYYVNDTLVYTSLVASTGTLLVDAACETNTTILQNITLNGEPITPVDLVGCVWLKPPRNEANKENDVLGQPLTYTGECPYPAKLTNSHCGTFDGVSDYLSIPSLVGSETVISSGGTAVPTISAGRIDFTAGTCWDLQLSNGSVYPLAEGAGVKIHDTSGNDRHGDAVGVDWSQTQSEYHRNLLLGFTLYEHATLNSIKVPYVEGAPLAGYTPEAGYSKTFDCPAGAWHNGAESHIDFTGGVAFPGSAGLDNDWPFDESQSNPFFHRTFTKNSNAYRADRFLNYKEVLSGDRLSSVQAFTETKEV